MGAENSKDIKENRNVIVTDQYFDQQHIGREYMKNLERKQEEERIRKQEEERIRKQEEERIRKQEEKKRLEEEEKRLEEEKINEIKNNIIVDESNFSKLKEKYNEEMKDLFNEDKLDNYLTPMKCYFLLLFPVTRKKLFENTEYKNILLFTKHGREILIENKETNLLLSTDEGKIDILNSEYKNHLCDTPESKNWALNHNNESRIILMNNPETIGMLATTNEGKKLLYDNHHYQLLSNNDLLYYIYIKNRFNLLNTNIFKYIIQNIVPNHLFYIGSETIDIKDYAFYDKNGFGPGGFDIYGYNKDGFDNQGYDRHGYDKDGFNKNGYNRHRIKRNGYDDSGYDYNRYDKYDKNIKGLVGRCSYRDKWGYSTCTGDSGYNEKGYNKNGFDKFGFDSQNYDKMGYHRESRRNREGFDMSGYDENGINMMGYDKNGFLMKSIDTNKFICHYDLIRKILEKILDSTIKQIKIEEVWDELFKHDLFFAFFVKHQKIDLMLRKEASCIFLALYHPNHNEILIENEYGRIALLKTKLGRDLLNESDRYQRYLVKCDKGLDLLKKTNENILYQYMQEDYELISKYIMLNVNIICPQCRQINDSYTKNDDPSEDETYENCCVCLERFPDAKFTKCMHSICVECINRMMEAEQKREKKINNSKSVTAF
jgi:hypothetical protein